MTGKNNRNIKIEKEIKMFFIFVTLVHIDILP